MKVSTGGRDYIAGGKIFHAATDGTVEVPDAIARAEGLLPADEGKGAGTGADEGKGAGTGKSAKADA